ncbi:MAG TPA: SpoIID/LytB domain-containing protein [Stenomitos sp.]
MRGLWLALLILVGLAGHAQAREPERVEVRILERRGLHELRLLAPAPHRLQAVGNELLVDGRPSGTQRLAEDGFALRLDGRVRRYPGRLQAWAERGVLVLVNEAPLEDYVAGVVGAELPRPWPHEALKAQAVLARTLALRGGDHPGRRLCDLTHCEAYAGLADAAAMRAARETHGLVLTYRGAVARPLFHSTCGGALASNQVVFGGAAVPYLQEGRDAYCAASPHAATWSVRVSPAEVAQALGRDRVRTLEVSDRSAGGWVGAVRVDGDRMTGYRLWQALGRSIGWGALKSLNFQVHRDGAAFVFAGRGLGHGVGLCQWGARGRAEAGWDFRRILAAYFPGAVVKRG